MSGISLPAFALAVGMSLLQNYLLYFPEKAPVTVLARDGLRAWPEPGDFRGLLAEPPAAPRGTVVVFHGNAGHAGHRGIYAAILVDQGFRVILAEYPGYGPREGSLGQEAFVADAKHTLRLAHRLYGSPLLVMGESLGAAVAAGAVSGSENDVDGLLLITPWDRLEGLAEYHYPWLPVSLLMSDHYDNIANLAAFRRPVAVVLAGSDRIIPRDFGIRLYESLQAPRKLEIVQGADHNDWLDRVDSGWWSELLAFLTGGAQK